MRALALLVATTLSLAWTGAALADEPPPETDAPRADPAPADGAAPGTAPAARAAAAEAEEWTQPVDPRGQPAPHPLPPPEVRSAPGSAAPAGAPGTAPAPPKTRILALRKTHNLPLRTGALALRLDVEFSTLGEAGRSVYLAAWFAERPAGRLVTSTLPAYADGANHLTVQTLPAQVAADGRHAASLWVPYAAFPRARNGDPYDVEARVQLLRRETDGFVTVLGESKTPFTVHGRADAIPAAGPAPTPPGSTPLPPPTAPSSNPPASR